ncbi:MFS transporter [Salmonella enterica subsp. enterica serovar Senftenberg]|nr:MFS transporter [Salmonella enterica subsp. enterica serovar Senftenberg]
MKNDLNAKWLRIGATLMFGLLLLILTVLIFPLRYLRLHDLNIDGATASIVLTIFLIGYAFSNIFGVFTQRYDPKNSHSDGANLVDCDRFVGFTSSVYVILICRLVLGITEGIYWPQQSRFASDWFSDKERTQANSIIQYYGQFPALGPIYDFVSAGCCLRLAKCFYYHWCDRHCCCGSTLYNNAKKQEEAPYYRAPAPTEKLNLPRIAGRNPFLLLIFTYITQGMLFWELRYGYPWLSILSAIPDSVKHWSVLCLI